MRNTRCISGVTWIEVWRSRSDRKIPISSINEGWVIWKVGRELQCRLVWFHSCSIRHKASTARFPFHKSHRNSFRNWMCVWFLWRLQLQWYCAPGFEVNSSVSVPGEIFVYCSRYLLIIECTSLKDDKIGPTAVGLNHYSTEVSQPQKVADEIWIAFQRRHWWSYFPNLWWFERYAFKSDKCKLLFTRKVRFSLRETTKFKQSYI